MPDYNALRLTADRLIGSFGSMRTCDITRRVETAYDPITDTGGFTETTYTIKCVIVPLGERELNTPDDNLTLHNSTSMMVPALGLPIVPLPGDRVILPQDPDPYVVTDCGPSRPDGDPIYYKVILQRADA